MRALSGYVLVDNIVELFPSKQPQEDKSMAFMRDVILPWLETQGVDIRSPSFKYQGGTILTCLQGLVNHV